MTALSAFLPIDRCHALAAGRAIPDRVYGTALFADISGFTPLTGALTTEMGRQRGAEAVLDYINPIYEALIGKLYQYGGTVIGFAGDSITCWLDGDNGWRAVQCAFAMQQIVREMGLITTPGGTQAGLSIKIGVALGPARRFLVGDPDIHLFEAMAGATLQRMAEAEGQAEKGDVILSREAVEKLGEAIVVDEWRPENDPLHDQFAHVTGLNSEGFHKPVRSTKGWHELPDGTLKEEQLRPWIDKPVYDRLQSGAAYLAELRPVTSLFLRFSGIDYDGDDQAGDKLDAYVRWVQAILRQYEGTMTQLTIGDKGSNLLAAFGAPVAQDDDMARAAAAALDLHSPPESMNFIQSIQMGISQGLAWAGAVGGRLRCIYSVMGDEVNMAARLMGKAANGQILVNQYLADATARRFQYHSLGAIQVKGREAPLPVSELVCRSTAPGQALTTLFQTPLVGREDVLEGMLTCLANAGQNKGQVLRLEGQAGVGKSHLTAAFATQAAALGWQTVLGLCQSTAQDSPYTPWQQFLLALLAVEPGETPQQMEQVQSALLQANPDWAPRILLLGDLLGLPFAETPLTTGLEPKQRREALLTLVVEIVHTWAVRQPLLLVLEDVHWLDEASAGLAVAVGRAIANSAAVLLLVQRPPLEDQAILPELDSLPYHHLIQLGDLAPEGVATLARNRLEAPLSQLGLQLLLTLAHGNPFFTEELLNMLREVGYLVLQAGHWELSEQAFNALIDGNCLVKMEGEWQFVDNPPLGNVGLDIPDTVQGTVLSRLDRLPEAHKLTLKVASVIGRTFSLRLLQAVHPAAPAQAELESAIELAGRRDFVRQERPGSDPVFIFKHNTTQEVAYGTLLFAQRKALHARVGEWYEVQYNDRPLAELTLEAPLAAYYPLLAYHWHQAEQHEREWIYAGLAGEQAAKKFANESAVRYYSRALDLAPADDLPRQWKLFLGREDVYDVLGQRQEQQFDLDALARLNELLQDERLACRFYLRKMRFANMTGDFLAGVEFVQSATEKAFNLRDAGLQAEALHDWGRLLWQIGDFPKAQDKLLQALELARTAEDQLQQGRCYSDLGLVYRDQQNYPLAIAHFERAQSVFQQISYRHGEIICLLSLGAIHYSRGNYLAAQQDYEQAHKLSHALGLRYPESFSLGYLGNNAFDLGDYSAAESFHRRAVAITHEIGNWYMEAGCLDTLSLVFSFRGDFEEALEFSQHALELQKALGNQQSQGFTLNHMGLALAGMGDRFAARDVFEQAMRLRISLGQYALALDDRAGLARLELAEGNYGAAQEQVIEILDSIAEHGIEGCEFPIWVYLTCFRVLHMVGNYERADQALRNGIELLQQRAKKIQDEILRRQFLENVPFNRELQAEFTSLNGPE